MTEFLATKLFIDDEWIDAADGRTIEVRNPADGTAIGSVAHASTADLDRALEAADEVVVLDVHLAREDPDPSVTGELVAAACRLPADRVSYVEEFDAAPAELVRRARAGDLVLTLGAGSVTELGPRVLDLLGKD